MLTVIVAPNEKTAGPLREQVKFLPDFKVITPTINQIHGWIAEMIIVHPDVDLSVDVDGEGQLGKLLQARQRTFENPIFMRL